MCTPGHGQGRFSSLPSLIGQDALGCDLTELADLASLTAPTGVIAQAQVQAAYVWGAAKTYFLVNGATVGLQALLLATLRRGEQVLLPRNVHSAVVGALILGGLVPIWLEPLWDEVLGIAHGVTVAAVTQALVQHAQIRAVLLVYPTYYGICAPLAELVQLIHSYDLPVLVDSAHGAHLAFHPDLPQCAVQAGADGVVQSTHKTAGSLTQSAMLHLQGNHLVAERIEQALQLLQTTSPSYLLLASLEAATEHLHNRGQELWAVTIERVQRLVQALNQLVDCYVLTAPVGHSLDPTRLTLGVAVSGYALEDYLISCNIHPELAGCNHVVFLITPAHGEELLTRLLPAINEGLSTLDLRPVTSIAVPPTTYARLDLNTAYWSTARSVPLTQSSYQTSAQTLALYPPGIPLLLPGEVLTPELIAYIQARLSDGATVRGLGLGQTVQIVASG